MRITTIAAALLCAACQQTPAARHDDCEVTAAAIGNAAAALIASDNRRDLPGVLAGYTDDVIWITPAGEFIQGRDALRPRYESMFQNEVALTIEILEARGSGDVGYARGITRGSLTPPNGGAAQAVGGKFLAITRCTGGHWLVSHLMWTG